MKYSKIALACLFFTYNTFAADSTQFQYVEASISTLTNISSNAGFGVEGKFELVDHLYLNGAYEGYSFSDGTVDFFTLGTGVKNDINEHMIPFAQLDYINYIGDGNDAYQLSAGVAGSYDPIHYKVGLTHYFIDSDDENIVFIDVSYKFKNSFSVIAKAEIWSEGEIYSLGGRYSF